MAHTVFIADDHPIVLGGLIGLISSDHAFSVVGTATDGRTALDQVVALAPDVAVLDLNMPGMSGLDVLDSLGRERGETRVILLAATLTNAEIFDASRSGAAGILLKEMAPSTLMDCLRQVAGGGRWVPGEMASALAEEDARRTRWRDLASHLTQRETEIVSLVAAGKANKDIAFALGISEGTAKVHLNSIFRKLGVDSRQTLRALASGNDKQAQ